MKKRRRTLFSTEYRALFGSTSNGGFGAHGIKSEKFLDTPYRALLLEESDNTF